MSKGQSCIVASACNNLCHAGICMEEFQALSAVKAVCTSFAHKVTCHAEAQAQEKEGKETPLALLAAAATVEG